MCLERAQTTGRGGSFVPVYIGTRGDVASLFIGFDVGRPSVEKVVGPMIWGEYRQKAVRVVPKSGATVELISPDKCVGQCIAGFHQGRNSLCSSPLLFPVTF